MADSVVDNVSMRWILERVAVPLIFLGLTAWMTNMNIQIKELQVNINEINQTNATLNANQVNMTSQLSRIEDKIDKIVDRQIVSRQTTQ